MFKKAISLLMILCLVMVSTGCAQEEKRVVVASKPMTEQFIIAEMIIALIEEETDITVEHKQGIGGGTSNIHPAMEKGEIDIYPEYTGTGWMFVLKEDLITDPMKLYDEVKKSYKDTYDIVWSGLYGFNDTYGLGINRALAEEHNLETYTDLAAKSELFTFGAEFDFFERDDGFPGLDAVYGFDFKDMAELDIGLKYQAVGADEVDLINIFSTDGRLKEFDLEVLEDDRNFFPSYYCATLIRQETLDEYPELEGVLDMLTGQISNDEMTELNYLVEIEKLEAKVVAVNFLTEKGLIK